MKKISILLVWMAFLSTSYCQAQPDFENEPDKEEFIYEDETHTVEEATEATKSDYEYFETPKANERNKNQIFDRKLDSKFKDNYKGKRFKYEKPEKENKPYTGTKLNLSFLFSKVVMYTILVLIILVIVYYIIKNSGGFSFGNERKRIKYNSDAEQSFEDKENIENNDFTKLIQKAKAEYDFRLATRYYFLWVLQTLSDKKIIQWNRDKTNYDYFIELGNHPICDDFFRNTHLYDYIWYGNFKLDDNDFKTVESIFQKTLNKLV